MKLSSVIYAVCLSVFCASWAIAQQTKWSIGSAPVEGSENVIYLKGQQETDNRPNKFMIACSSPISLFVIYHDVMNAEDVAKWPVNWLFLDGQRVRIDKHLHSKKSNHGEIQLDYGLNSDLLRAISKAKRVGVGLQPATGAAAFSGFNSMPFGEDAAKKLSEFLIECNSTASLSNNASLPNPKPTWVAVLVVYAAPDDAVNWHGPWTRGKAIAGQDFFSSEAECRANTEAKIKAIHQGMLAPILYQCVPFQESVR
jgi:hypothetical protein